MPPYQRISKIAWSFSLIQQVPGLGILFGHLGLGKSWHGFVVILFGAVAFGMSAYGLCIWFARLVTTPEPPVWLLLTGGVSFPGLVVASIVIAAGIGLVYLNREVRKFGTADSRPWLKGFFRNKSRIPRRLPRPIGKRIWIVFLMAVRWCLVFYSFGILATSGLAPRDYPIGSKFIAYLFAAFLFTMAIKLRERIRRHCCVPGKEVIKSDPRPPVLLLRPFGDDQIKLPNAFWTWNFGKQHRFEEELAMASWHLGPVIAIGKPGERLPLYGACREYVPSDDWQGRARQLMKESGHLVIIVGGSKGLLWETEQIVNCNYAFKTFFIVPPVEPDELTRRIQALSAVLKLPPEGQGIPTDLVAIGYLPDGLPFFIGARKRLPVTYRVAFIAAEIIQLASAHRGSAGVSYLPQGE